MARKTQQRSLRQPEITIIGEGATERFYFTNLRRLKGYRYTCKPRNFTEQSLDEIQKQVDRVLADLLADHRLETAIQRAGDGFAAIVCHAKVERIELLEES